MKDKTKREELAERAKTASSKEEVNQILKEMNDISQIRKSDLWGSKKRTPVFSPEEVSQMYEEDPQNLV